MASGFALGGTWCGDLRDKQTNIPQQQTRTGIPDWFIGLYTLDSVYSATTPPHVALFWSCLLRSLTKEARGESKGQVEVLGYYVLWT